MRLSNFRIGVRLGLGFGLVIVFTVLMCLFAITEINSLSDMAARLHKHPYAVTVAALRIESGIAKMNHGLKDVVLAEDAAGIEKAVAEVAKTEAQTLRQFDVIEDRFLGNQDKVYKARELFVGWQPLRDQIIELMRQGKRAEAETIARQKGSDYAERLKNFIDSFIGLSQSKAAGFVAKADDAKDSAYFTIMRLGAVIVLISIGFAWYLTRGITKPVGQALDVARRMAQGDLTVRVGSECKDETGRMLSAMSEMVGKLSSMIGSNVASSKLMAQGAGEQASSLEQTSASLEELNSMAKQNADNAQQAAGLTGNARQVVEKANESMTQLKESIAKIDAASGEMAKIIKTIDEIAFQTNLLALNAAVEAARAGEAGAGFAVVADEVRNLAMRAADAARSTSSLIEENISNIKQGSNLVSVTDEAFTEVVDSVGKVKQLVGEIAAATSEQTQGIMQISQAMNQMDKVTQANAAGAEEIAASMAMFKVDLICSNSSGTGVAQSAGNGLPLLLEQGKSSNMANPEAIIPLGNAGSDFGDF